MNHSIKFLFLGLLSVILITGCKKDDDSDPSYFQVDDESYALARGTLEYYGTTTNGYEHAICLLTKGITVGEDDYWDGSGQALWIEVVSSSATSVPSGTYSFPASGYPVFSIYDAEYCLNWTESYSTNTWVNINLCVVTVSHTSNNYIVDIEGIDDNGYAVKGHYEGSLPYYDWSKSMSLKSSESFTMTGGGK